MSARRRHGEGGPGARARGSAGTAKPARGEPGDDGATSAASARGGRRSARSTVFVGGPHAVRAALTRMQRARVEKTDAHDDASRSGGVGAVARVYVDAHDGGGHGGRPSRAGQRSADLVGLAREVGVPVSRLSRGECDRLTGVRSQGVAAEIDYLYADYDTVLTAGERATVGPGRLLLFLDGIEDPQNLGAIIRTAEAAGILAVVLQARRSAPVTAAVVRASAGAAIDMAVCRVTNLVQAMRKARGAGYWLVGLDQEGPGLLAAAPANPAATAGRAAPADAADPAGSGESSAFQSFQGLVVGGEGRGLRRLVAESCDEIARLPMRGRVESLNASVAASLAIYRVCEKTLFDR